MAIDTAQDFVDAYKKHGSIKAVARNEGISYRWKARKLYHQAVTDGLMAPLPVGAKPREKLKEPLVAIPTGKVRATQTRTTDLPEPGKIKSYLFTSAQNDTLLFEPFWKNLLVFKDHWDAELHVSRFVYLKTGLNTAADKAQAFERARLNNNTAEKTKFAVTWVKELDEYLSDYRMEVAPGLVWCGEMNILPTAVRPLSDLQVYTGRRSGIFPHVKLAMESIPSMREDPTKFNYTTGTVTQRNYIQRKAGLKAEFHHCYGALFVQVDSEGNWYCRQINADSEGTFYEADIRVKNGKLTTGHRLEGINWGDIHDIEMDPTVRKVYWGEGGVLDTLQPKNQFFHDVITFRGRSHHDLKDPYVMYRRYLSGEENIRQEVEGAVDFFKESYRPWCKGIVVDSNHHRHLGRWLKEQDGRLDPVNAVFWSAMQQRIYHCMGVNPNEEPLYLCEAIKEIGAFGEVSKQTTWLKRDQSFILCEDAHGGIECGEHGDDGANGARGNTRSYARMGRRINKQHDHQAAIIDGAFSAGTCSTLNPDWTSGPSSWSHSMIWTYANGKRAIATLWAGKWRA